MGELKKLFKICLFVIRVYLFQRFDVNKDGVIDSSDLKALMGDIGNELRDSEIFDMIQEADKNGDGVVDYDGKWD